MKALRHVTQTLLILTEVHAYHAIYLLTLTSRHLIVKIVHLSNLLMSRIDYASILSSYLSLTQPIQTFIITEITRHMHSLLIQSVFLILILKFVRQTTHFIKRLQINVLAARLISLSSTLNTANASPVEVTAHLIHTVGFASTTKK